MLYVSTRSKTDSFTAYRAMHNENAPDEGAFVPFQHISFTPEDLQQMRDMTFSGVVAKVLNIYYSCDLTDRDVEFCIGKNPVRFDTPGHKTTVAELWHNHGSAYAHTVSALYRRICGNDKPSQWAEIMINIAILSAVCLQMSDGDCCDLSVSEDETLFLAAAWYAKNAGMPIGRILIACNDGSPIWDFIRTGTLNTLQLVKYSKPLCGLIERVIYETYGHDETANYLACLDFGKNYVIDEEMFDPIKHGFSAVVLGKGRAEAVVSSVLRTNGYQISPDAALAFGALQDYRSCSGDSRVTLLLSTKKT